jgi:predicted amidohydrolase
MTREITRPVTIGLVQMAMNEDPTSNLTKALDGISKAATRGAQVICLPELFRSPYFCRMERCERDYAEAVPGEVGAALADAARTHEVVLIAGSVYEHSPDGRFNTAMVFSEKGDLLGTYRKMHIPHDPSFYEQHYFARGDQGYRIFETTFGKIAVLICYDQWFPEAARTVALMGADMIFYPTAIGTLENVEQTEGNWQEAWENVQRGHAIANGMVVAATNRVGKEDDSIFWGGSFICDAFGKTLARGGAEEDLVLATVDLDHGHFVKEGWRFFYNRRPDTYTRLTSES